MQRINEISRMTMTEQEPVKRKTKRKIVINVEAKKSPPRPRIKAEPKDTTKAEPKGKSKPDTKGVKKANAAPPPKKKEKSPEVLAAMAFQASLKPSEERKRIHDALLNEKFSVWKDCLPLAIGAHKQIKKYLKENLGQSESPTKSSFKSFMFEHCTRLKYIDNVINGDCRYDIEGNKYELTEKDKQYATELKEKRVAEIKEKKHKE